MHADTLLKKYIFLNDIKNQFTQNIDFSKTTVTEIAEKTYQSSYIKSQQNSELHDYIFKFYAYNELLASFRDKQNGVINQEDLKIFTEYQDFVNDFSKRIFSFILHACMAEARHGDSFGNEDDYDDDYHDAVVDAYVKHSLNEFETGKKTKLFSSFLKNLSDDYSTVEIEKIKTQKSKLQSKFKEYLEDWSDMPYDLPESFQKSFRKNYSNENSSSAAKKIFRSMATDKKNLDNVKLKRFNTFWNFLNDLSNMGYDGDSGSLQREIVRNQLIQKSNIKDFPITEVLENLSGVFLQDFSDYGSYGGEPWSEIAKHALSFAKGDINAEMFIDRALSLEHNNGQMFNKSFIFDDNFSSNYVRFLTNNSSLQTHHISMNLKDLILNLQNSSSVLSVSKFINKDWNSLTKNLDKKSLSNINSNLNNSHLTSFKDNFNSFSQSVKKLKFLPEMLKLANKIDYSIPPFDFSNMILVALDKHESEYKNDLEKDTVPNQLFSNIINGNFEQLSINNKNKTEPTFNCHNLNLKTAKSLTKELIGGKAFGLTELIKKGFNVPKAMVFDTKTCLSYLANPKFFDTNYKKINTTISEYLVDDDNNPLLVSVRSGAPVSMPGMMDSILNVGIDDETYPKLCSIYGKEMINECVFSFMHQFCSSKLGLEIKFPKNFNKALDKFAEILIKNDIPCDRLKLFPLNKEAQVKLCVEAVFDSWNSPRAIAWRNEKKFSHDMGTAATIQKMVFGNKNENSLTTVIFSRDCISGDKNIMGEYLVKAQGEDLVSGRRTPLPIQELKTTMPDIYKQIEYIAKVLEVEKKAIQDLEITVEDGNVYLLQMRNAVVSPEAQLALAKELNLNLLDVVQPKNLIGDVKVDTNQEPEFKGLAASPGLISGIVIQNEKDVQKFKNSGKPLIFFSNQALPEHAPIMIATDAFITEFGGATSHAAILARSMGKPCVVGIGKQSIKTGDTLTIDAINGKIWKGELSIILNQKDAINLSEKLLKENNVTYNKKEVLTTPVSLNSWTTELSKFNIIKKVDKKNKMFLNIAQKAALALKLEHNKTHKIK